MCFVGFVCCLQTMNAETQTSAPMAQKVQSATMMLPSSWQDWFCLDKQLLSSTFVVRFTHNHWLCFDNFFIYLLDALLLVYSYYHSNACIDSWRRRLDFLQLFTELNFQTLSLFLPSWNLEMYWGTVCNLLSLLF